MAIDVTTPKMAGYIARLSDNNPTGLLFAETFPVGGRVHIWRNYDRRSTALELTAAEAAALAEVLAQYAKEYDEYHGNTSTEGANDRT